MESNKMPEFIKLYVNVMVEHTSEGKKIPRWIRLDNGKKYMIDKVTDCRRAAAAKVGGTGIRYTIMVCGKECKLFEDEDKWFVEGIAARL